MGGFVRVVRQRIVSGCCAALVLSGCVVAAEPAPKPVDDSMHHFMEYFFEPAYKRLKADMARPNPDRAVWKSVKGDSLTLAEGTNLLMLRGPEENGNLWVQRSVEVREHAAALYQAARAQDAAKAGQAYRAMIVSCNACHTDFADGEHQLQP